MRSSLCHIVNWWIQTCHLKGQERERAALLTVRVLELVWFIFSDTWKPLTLFIQVMKRVRGFAVGAGKFPCTESNLLEVKAAVKVHPIVNVKPLPKVKASGIFCSTGAADVTAVCSNCADILQSGTSLHVASSWLARLNCWALPFQGRLCPAMASLTWLIPSPRGKSIQRGASLGKFCLFLLLFLFDYEVSNRFSWLTHHNLKVIGKP